MADYLVPLLLGFSFGNLWICALLVFSLQTTNRSTCGGYLIGRALTIVALSVLVSLIGRVVTIEPGVLNLVSGVFLLAFSAYLAGTQIFEWVPPWKKARAAEPDHSGCDGECSSCPTRGHHELEAACSSCSDDPRLCAAEEPELEPLTRGARLVRGREGVRGPGRSGFLAGMALGSLRGAALCSKLTILVPVLLGAPVGRAVGMGLTFSVSSSVYPLMGFLVGSFALKLVRYKRWLFGASCVLIALFGIYYLIQGVFYLLD